MLNIATSSPIRILLVEDDRGIAEIIRDGIDPNAFVLGWAADVGQARRCLASRTYDVMVLDLALPDGNGLSIAEQLRSSGSEMPILVLTANSALADRMEGFRCGADDYLCKPFAVEELIARLHAILRRTRRGGRNVLSYRDVTLDLVTRRAWRSDMEVSLSARETELLAYFMRHPDRVMDRDRILEEVWGDEAEEDGNVLSVYVNYLRNKIERGRYPRVIHTIRGVGYMLSNREPEEILKQ